MVKTYTKILNIIILSFYVLLFALVMYIMSIFVCFDKVKILILQYVGTIFGYYSGGSEKGYGIIICPTM